MQLRVLGAIRQSKRKDHSESPETQRLSYRAWIASHPGGVLVHETQDVGVSASISPFKRRELGPWLTDPDKLATWDVLVVWKVDRLVRDMTHFYGELVPEMARLGKRVVAASEGIDTDSSHDAEIMFKVYSAQEELKKIRHRATESRARLRESARWAGGPIPYGTKPVKRPEGGKTLVVDEESLGWIVTMRDVLREGGNPNTVANYLNQEGVPTPLTRHEALMGRTPKVRFWTRTQVCQLLQSRHLLGELLHKGGTVRREDGSAVMLMPTPVLTRPEWDELQTLTRRGARGPKTNRKGGSMLLHVAYCNSCGRPMYYQVGRNSHPDTYYCSRKTRASRPDCFAVEFPAALLEDFVGEMFLGQYGGVEIVERSAVALVDYDSQINEVDEKIDTLTDNLALLPANGRAAERARENLVKLEGERAELIKLSKEAQGVKVTHTGRTFGQEWLKADPEGRGALLRRHGITVMVQRKRQRRKRPEDLVFPDFLRIDFPGV
ncbi:recombinase family protein [Amycolatopsis sp. NPDC004772]